MPLIISFLSISPMYARRRLPYLTKDDSGEELYNYLSNEGLILVQWRN